MTMSVQTIPILELKKTDSAWLGGEKSNFKKYIKQQQNDTQRVNRKISYLEQTTEEVCWPLTFKNVPKENGMSDQTVNLW